MSDNFMLIYGRLTRKPEFTPANGDRKQYAKFTVAVNRSYGDQADFVDCIAFGRTADVIDKYFDKGKEIRVQGRHECDKYVAKDGTNRYPWTLKVESIGFCGSRQSGSSSGTSPNPEPAPENYVNVDEDIPF